jgi:hypothetical protein
VIQAGLVAGDAGVDGVGAAGGGLGHERGIGQEGRAIDTRSASPRARIPPPGVVDAVAGDHGQLHHLLQASAQGAEGPRHAAHDGGDACLMPADAGVQQVDARAAALGKGFDLIPGAAALHEVEQGQAEDEDEVRAGGGPHGTQHFQPEAAAVLETAAPAVVPKIGAGGQELVDQIALRAHHLDAVVTGLAGQGGAAGVVGDGLEDLVLAQGPGVAGLMGALMAEGPLAGGYRNSARYAGVAGRCVRLRRARRR